MEARSERKASGPHIRVLMISNMFPSGPNPVYGVFVARQVAALKSLGVDVHLVKNTEWRGGLRSLPKYLWLTLRALSASALHHDIVVGHYLYPTAWIARIVHRHAPYVVVAHGTDARSAAGTGLIARLSRWGLLGADRVIAVSSALAEMAHTRLGLPGTDSVSVIHMGVDTEAFQPDPIARAGLGWAADERIALFTGNLIQVKGPDIAVKAFAELADRGVCDRLVLVGDGSMREELQNLVGQLGLGDAVTFAGKIDTASVASRMAAADVLIMSSRDEGLGLVALEAMACGTPVVAARVGGLPEVFPADGSCGMLVEPENPKALAAAAEAILSQGKEQYCDACVQAAAMHDVKVKAGEFLAVLQEVIDDSESS